MKTTKYVAILVFVIAGQMGFPKEELVHLMQDQEFIQELGFNTRTFPALFIPNTYFVYWTMKPEDLLRRFKKEYDAFWTEDRLTKAKLLKLSKEEVVTLASIVQAESYLPKERPTVAGVYLNRLRKGMLLQADPTVIYAMGDFTIKRVLKRYLVTDSPYNTYKYAGLPPGPINNPEINSIDAVLNFQKHDYIYFCARADFSGYHAFAKTLSEHNANARAWQAALNQRKVYK